MSKDIIDEEIYLKDYKKFIEIDKKYYGGNQSWLREKGYFSKFKADRSCGLIAATNTILYMLENNEKLDKEEYMDFVFNLSKFIKPRIYGIATIPIMVKGLNSYVKSINFNINPFLLINPSNKLRLVEYIKEALEKDSPIMMLTWNSEIRNLKYHWVTITGYNKTKDGKHYVIASNWGKRQVFNLDDWFDENLFYKGLVYFTFQEMET